MIFRIKFLGRDMGGYDPPPGSAQPLVNAYEAMVIEVEKLQFMEEKDWRRNYDTNEMGWENGRIAGPKQGWFDQGFDHAFEETTRPVMDTQRIHTYTRKVECQRWVIELESLDELTALAQSIDVLVFYSGDILCLGV